MHKTTLYLPDELIRSVLTLDRRDLGVVAREGTITVLPG
jgi:hypothetical protein